MKKTIAMGLFGGVFFGLFAGLFKGMFEGLNEGISRGLITGLIVGLSAALFKEPQTPEKVLKIQPYNIQHSLQDSFIGGGLFGLGAGFISGLSIGINGGLIEALLAGLFFGLSVSFIGGVIFGILTYIQYLKRRWSLYRDSDIPDNYTHFLDYSTERTILRKVGGGYVFIHRIVLEHIAALTDGDIQSIIEKSTPS